MFLLPQGRVQVTQSSLFCFQVLQGDSALRDIVQSHVEAMTPGPYACCDMLHAARASLA